MKVSLKEARRIERRIENTMHDNVDFRSEIDIYEEITIDFAVEEARKTTEDKIFNAIALVNARSLIRRAIQEANEIEGINYLIAKRERLIRIGGIWFDVVTADTGEASVNALRKMVDVKIERSKQSTTGYYDNNGVAFNTISKAMSESAKNEKHSTQKLIDECDDKIAVKNATVTIEIPNDTVALLKENKII